MYTDYRAGAWGGLSCVNRESCSLITELGPVFNGESCSLIAELAPGKHCVAPNENNCTSGTICDDDEKCGEHLATVSV